MASELDRIVQVLDRLDIATPPALADALDVERATTALATDDPLPALAEDVMHGRVTASTAANRVEGIAIQLATRAQAREVVRALEVPLRRRAVTVLLTEADGIVESLRPIFGEHVAALTETTAVLGAHPSPEVVRGAGAAVATAYSRWEETVMVLAHVERVRKLLASSGYGPSAPLTCPEWYVTNLRDGDHLEAARNAWNATGDRLTALAAHGFELHLNTARETAELVARAEGVTARRQMEAEMARRQEHDAETERLTRPYRDWAAGVVR